MSNNFKTRPTHFYCVGEKFSWGVFAPLITGLWTSIHHKKLKFSCVLYPQSQFLCSLAKFELANQGVRRPVQTYTFSAQLPAFDETLAQPDFAVVNCSDVVMSVFHSHVLTRSLIFLQL